MLRDLRGDKNLKNFAPFASLRFKLKGPGPRRKCKIRRSKMKKLIPVIILFLLNLSCSDIINGMFEDMPDIVPVCVDKDTLSSGDGRGWVNAVQSINEALALVKEGGEIWIKSGTCDIGAVIEIGGSVENFSIYGGFAGTESRREQRDVSANETILNSSSGNGIISLSGARSVTLDGFTFRASASLGGNSAVTVDSSEGIVFRSCVFDSLTGSGDGTAVRSSGSGVGIEECNFSNNYADGNGGALYGNGSTISISGHSLFDINSAYRGGAIYLEGNSEISITDTDLTNNNSELAYNSGSNGGAIYLENTTAVINNSKLIGNYSEDNANGGALYIDNNTGEEVNIINSEFKYNGYLDSTSKTFNGGAIYLLNGSLNISGAGSDISSNCTNNGAGGGIYIYGGNLSISNASISNNGFIGVGAPETQSGGGIYFRGSSLTIDRVKFINNQAEDNGGGIFINPVTADININNSLFRSNRAINNDGGALYLNNGALNFANVTFYDNSANNNGGAIYSNIGATIYNSVFYGNSGSAGNNIYVNNGTVSISYCFYYGGLDTGGSGIIDTSGDGNINDSTNPFMSTTYGADDFLYPDVIIIDAGYNDAISDYLTDLAGNTRIINGTVDIGAYEWQGE